jgi:hypothetical protein
VTRLPDISYRTPVPPRPVERIDLTHPLVPAGVEGTTLLQVSDLHARRAMLKTGRVRMILEALRRTEADLVVLTGDLMDEPGHERGALELLEAMAGAWRARAGVYGVFGNHDTPEFRRACVARFPGIGWIGGRGVDVRVRGGTLRLVGMDWPEDPLGLALAGALDGAGGGPVAAQSSGEPSAHGAGPAGGGFAVALAHHPTSFVGVAGIGVPVVLCGHTHGGQIRLHPGFAPYTSSDLPPHLAAGMLRLGDSVCCISRGLGDGVVEGLRINCPRQMPLYTLRRGKIPGEDGGGMRRVVAW